MSDGPSAILSLNRPWKRVHRCLKMGADADETVTSMERALAKDCQTGIERILTPLSRIFGDDAQRDLFVRVEVDLSRIDGLRTKVGVDPLANQLLDRCRYLAATGHVGREALFAALAGVVTDHGEARRSQILHHEAMGSRNVNQLYDIRESAQRARRDFDFPKFCRALLDGQAKPSERLQWGGREIDDGPSNIL